MAEILPFAGAAGHRRRSTGEAAGEIVIFPGVRVEYHDAAPIPQRKARSRRNRRIPEAPFQPEAAGSGNGSA